MMVATLVHANPGTAKVLFLFAAVVFVLAFFVNLLTPERSSTWLVALVASVLLSVGLLFFA